MIHRCQGFVGLVVVCCLALSAGCISGLDSTEMALWENSLDEPDGASHGSQAEFSRDLAQGRNLERAGKYEEARAVYQRLLVAHPERHEPYHRLGVVADRQRRHREAQALYSQAIRLCNHSAELFNDLGYCLYLQGKPEKAEAALLKAVALCPAGSRYRNNLGLVLGHLGRYDEAMDEFRHAGSEADAYYNLAFVHVAHEDPQTARECLRLALAADPAHEPARRAVAAFDRYDEDPQGQPGLDQVAEDGGRWVPYVESSEPEPPDPVQPATQSDRPTTQSLLKQARAMMTQRMAEPQG